MPTANPNKVKRRQTELLKRGLSSKAELLSNETAETTDDHAATTTPLPTANPDKIKKRREELQKRISSRQSLVFESSMSKSISHSDQKLLLSPATPKTSDDKRAKKRELEKKYSSSITSKGGSVRSLDMLTSPKIPSSSSKTEPRQHKKLSSSTTSSKPRDKKRALESKFSDSSSSMLHSPSAKKKDRSTKNMESSLASLNASSSRVRRKRQSPLENSISSLSDLQNSTTFVSPTRTSSGAEKRKRKSKKNSTATTSSNDGSLSSLSSLQSPPAGILRKSRKSPMDHSHNVSFSGPFSLDSSDDNDEDIERWGNKSATKKTSQRLHKSLGAGMDLKSNSAAQDDRRSGGLFRQISKKKTLENSDPVLSREQAMYQNNRASSRGRGLISQPSQRRGMSAEPSRRELMTRGASTKGSQLQLDSQPSRRDLLAKSKSARQAGGGGEQALTSQPSRRGLFGRSLSAEGSLLATQPSRRDLMAKSKSTKSGRLNSQPSRRDLMAKSKSTNGQLTAESSRRSLFAKGASTNKSFRPGLDKSRSKMMLNQKAVGKATRHLGDISVDGGQSMVSDEQYELAVRRYFAEMERPPRSLVVIW